MLDILIQIHLTQHFSVNTLPFQSDISSNILYLYLYETKIEFKCAKRQQTQPFYALF